MIVKIYRILKLATALATVLLLAALVMQCISIYISGMNGTDPIYTAEAVASALSSLVPFFILYVLLVCAAVFAGAKAENGVELPGISVEKSPSIIKNQSSLLPEKAQREKKCRKRTERSLVVPRFIIFGAAVLLVIFGVLNGGAKDVFIKAINICTECIGLG